MDGKQCLCTAIETARDHAVRLWRVRCLFGRSATASGVELLSVAWGRNVLWFGGNWLYYGWHIFWCPTLNRVLCLRCCLLPTHQPPRLYSTALSRRGRTPRRRSSRRMVRINRGSRQRPENPTVSDVDQRDDSSVDSDESTESETPATCARCKGGLARVWDDPWFFAHKTIQIVICFIVVWLLLSNSDGRIESITQWLSAAWTFVRQQVH